MPILGYFKAQPNEFVIKYKAGKPVLEGEGLAFYFLNLNTQIVLVPTNSSDFSFIFNEVTNNFQSVTMQGQITYRIANPKQAAGLLNFSIDTRKRNYLSDDPDRLPQRITNIVQMQTRSAIQQRSLEQTLQQSEDIAAHVLQSIREQSLLAGMGVELLSVTFIAAKPTPEVAKALEADYRETLLKRADEAIYARRASAVEEERKIKELELNTDVALAQQRQALIELEGANAQQEAEFRGKALELEAAYAARAKEMDLALFRTMDPKVLLAMGMRELGENASNIGNLTITTELLAELLNRPDRPA